MNPNEKTNTAAPLPPENETPSERRRRMRLAVAPSMEGMEDLRLPDSSDDEGATNPHPGPLPEGEGTPSSTASAPESPPSAEADVSAKPGVTNTVLEELRERIRNARGMDRRAKFEFGRIYNDVLAQETWRTAGFPDASSFFKAEMGDYPEHDLKRFGAVATAFPNPSYSEKHGPRVLFDLLGYLKATGAKIPEGDPAETTIAVPQADQSVVNKRFGDCSAEEIENATAHVRAKQPKSKPDGESDEADAAKDEKPATGEKAEPAKIDSGAEALAQFARHLVELLNEGKLDEWAENLAEDCTYDYGNSSSGPGRAERRLEQVSLRYALPDLKYTVSGIYAYGDTAVIESKFEGTHKGPYQVVREAIPPTGYGVGIKQVQVLTVKDGKVTAIREYYDRVDLLSHLGLHPDFTPAERKPVRLPPELKGLEGFVNGEVK